ncbi:hypothetical protein NA57DRAFT_72748 [Rhizodiscina lignyota]|uniref:Zn(2)-C6 fungal-type domain-containing protein n=1 Tax=Rhizodiscina lignyota TaxID=1504668 RepID=A0A9P4MBE3_9PEZI|nr:hypothetical protein NA57DRAFT_72748 [Rhizodiscina lignyota]
MEQASQGRSSGIRIIGKSRRTTACNYCRAKKIRCNGSIPCANCLDRGEECVVTDTRRSRTQGSKNHDSADLSRRVQQLEALLGTGTGISKLQHVSQDLGLETRQSQTGSSIPQSLTPIHPQSSDQTSIPLQDSDPSPDVVDVQNTEQEDSSVYVKETPDLEYYGMSAMSCILLFTARSGMGHLKAYFEETPEEAFGIVERPWFESRLRAHFNGTIPDDKAWYALRNVIWASGCRIVLSKTASFREVSQASWAFFENALSVHTEILLVRASMVAVQALALMAYYSEGLGKTSLQYMLCSNAMRLACSKGLHRQPARSWNLSLHEVEHRNWMFWSIYCLEKHICSRPGRPSVMDDDEISCHVPQSASNKQHSSTVYCHILIKLMQLSSNAKKRLSSARALRQPPDQLIENVRDLNKGLHELKCSVQHEFSLDNPLEISQLPHDTAASAQSDASLNAVAQASRSAILATRQIRVDASCSALIALYSPVYSFIHLFIHVLRGTSTTTTQSDVALLDVAAGYFSNVEFATEFELKLSFAREVCHYARLAVDQKNENNKRQGIDKTRDTADDMITPPAGRFPNEVDAGGTAALTRNEDEFFGWLPDEDLELWSTLLPFAEDGGSAPGYGNW